MLRMIILVDNSFPRKRVIKEFNHALSPQLPDNSNDDDRQ